MYCVSAVQMCTWNEMKQQQKKTPGDSLFYHGFSIHSFGPIIHVYMCVYDGWTEPTVLLNIVKMNFMCT